jgi:FdhD protein
MHAAGRLVEMLQRRRRPHGLAWRGDRAAPATRQVAVEKPVALTYGGSIYEVMMATPSDLEDFGIGFGITEGIVEQVGEIESIGSPAGGSDHRRG